MMNRTLIAYKLRKLRGSRSQKSVAEAVGIGQPAYAMIESGKRIPRDSTKQKLAELYGVTVDEIFFADSITNKDKD